jgi:hypothetical protein
MLALLVARPGALTRPGRGCGLLATRFGDDTFLIHRIWSAFPDRWLSPQWRHILVIIIIRRRQKTKKKRMRRRKNKEEQK